VKCLCVVPRAATKPCYPSRPRKTTTPSSSVRKSAVGGQQPSDTETRGCRRSCRGGGTVRRFVPSRTTSMHVPMGGDEVPRPGRPQPLSKEQPTSNSATQRRRWPTRFSCERSRKTDTTTGQARSGFVAVRWAGARAVGAARFYRWSDSISSESREGSRASIGDATPTSRRGYDTRDVRRDKRPGGGIAASADGQILKRWPDCVEQSGGGGGRECRRRKEWCRSDRCASD